MDKPLVLKIKDTEEKIVNIINTAGIPAFIMKTSIEKIYNQLISIEQQEYASAKKEYDKNIKRSIENGKSKKV